MLVNEAKADEKLYNKQSVVLPLLIASFSGDTDLVDKVKRAISQGANINAKDNSGNSALHVTAWSTDNITLMRYLVESGANINATTQNGDTPLMDSAYLNKSEFLRYLLISGADPSLKNLSGSSALDLAKTETNRSLIKAEMLKRKKSH
jgi:ankyrin repeat protein